MKTILSFPNRWLRLLMLGSLVLAPGCVLAVDTDRDHDSDWQQDEREDVEIRFYDAGQNYLGVTVVVPPGTQTVPVPAGAAFVRIDHAENED